MSQTLQVVCPHCTTVNRFAENRLTQGPKCGRCHRRLFNAHPLALTAQAFHKHLMHNGIPLVVDFWAPWCGPCQMMAPAFEQAAMELEPELRLVKINTEAEQSLAAQYGIRNIPTLALFLGGREIARQSGAMGKVEIIRWVREHI